VVAGTGPLLLAVASYLATHGAKVVAIAEQAPLTRLARFSTQLLKMPGKLSQALELKRDLRGVPLYASCWPLAAHGSNQVESVTLSRKGKKLEIACDYLACGFHLIPNVELPLLLGCGLNGAYVAVDQWQATSVEQVYCAGEPTGIGGVELSIAEGQVAGFAAAGAKEEARRFFPVRNKYSDFARAMDRAFELRSELRSVPDDVFVCRCEDVTAGRLRGRQSWREAKLHTRIGMGPCQGRVCGGAASFLYGWKTESVRPPIFPAQVSHLAPLIEGHHSKEVKEFV
jgi:NADPH-dependent 2,4-dienoyl-CoA reductase/sulfur reductase-like enzyme